ncbi:hypothetical protein M885DRAFT_503672 [Pelagophyceae sp. CCMP2097]|nr:hypothetical protein M885DRAFT_503672 [Pelagophyceae sp. CCMP2097]
MFAQRHGSTRRLRGRPGVVWKDHIEAILEGTPSSRQRGRLQGTAKEGTLSSDVSSGLFRFETGPPLCNRRAFVGNGRSLRRRTRNVQRSERRLRRRTTEQLEAALRVSDAAHAADLQNTVFGIRTTSSTEEASLPWGKLSVIGIPPVGETRRTRNPSHGELKPTARAYPFGFARARGRARAKSPRASHHGPRIHFGGSNRRGPKRKRKRRPRLWATSLRQEPRDTDPV